MKTKFIICLGALLGVAAVAVRKQFELPKVRVNVHVADEAGHPVSGALVRFVFGKSRDANAIVRVEGNTSSSGAFTGEGHTGGSFGASVEKAGYYWSGLAIPPLEEIVHGRSQTVEGKAIMRPVGRPIPLFAKRVTIEIPVAGQPCGYDLEKGDWVAPHGLGVFSDFVFTLDRRYATRDDFDVRLNVRFSRISDGIQEVRLPEEWRLSHFRWPREAPEQGYEPVLVSRLARSQQGGTKASATEDQAYFFRVRTVERDGQVVSAHYGKISGGLILGPSNSATCLVRLTYYLNPAAMDRNLEWDTKRNLLSGLKDEEMPRQP
ncbi:MAG: hypothetical protein HZC55_24170 [Verrucomicrobia bacterium]|nr:hypothetical protein [Verrucomicrobiota bacterium]